MSTTLTCSSCKNTEECQKVRDNRVVGRTVVGRGSESPDFLIVGEGPNWEDSASGSAFSGSAESVLKSLLKEAGIDSRKVRYAMSVRCKLPNNLPPLTKQINLCRANLNEEIIRYRPKVIIPMGNIPCKSLLKKAGIKTLRGLPSTITVEGSGRQFTVLPTFSLHSLVYDPAMEAYIRQDFKRAAQILYGDTDALQDTDYQTVAEPAQAFVLLKELSALPNGTVVAMDIEANSVNVYAKDYDIISIAVCCEEKKSTCVLFEKISPRKFLGKLFALKNIRYLFHNGTYDVGGIRRYVHNFNHAQWLHDTILMSYLLDENTSHGLKALTAVHIPEMAGYESDISADVEEKGWEGIDLSTLAKYNCTDADMTYRLYNKFLPQIEEQGMKFLYDKIVMGGIRVLQEISFNGLCMDKELAAELVVKYRQVVEDIHTNIQGYPAVKKLIRLLAQEKMDKYNNTHKNQKDIECFMEPFNPASTQQKAKLIFDVLGYKVLKTSKTSGNASVDKGVLEEYAKKDKLCAKLIEYSKVGKLLGTYIEPVVPKWMNTFDGRSHSTYSLHTTVTGRGCIAKGTPIMTVGDVATAGSAGVPIEKVKIGDYVYTFDNSMKLAIKPVVWSGKTGHKEVYRVSWVGTGKRHSGYLDVTADHKFRLTTGEYVEAHNLKRGMCVGAVHRGVRLKRGSRLPYVDMYVSGTSTRLWEHIEVAKLFNADVCGEVVHHIDGNSLNNHPSNLKMMSKEDHAKYHGVTAPEELKQKRISVLKRADVRKACIESAKLRRGKNAYNWLGLTKEWMLAVLHEGKGKPTIFRDKYGIDYETVQRYMKLHGIDWKRDVASYYTQTGEFIDEAFYLKGIEIFSKYGQAAALKMLGVGYYTWQRIKRQYGSVVNNHIILSVEPTGKMVDVYDLEVEDTHNFIANEVCVHNSSKFPNHENIPRPDTNPDVRQMFVAPEGKVLMEADFSQLELRIAAMYGQDKVMSDAFAHGKDVHKILASKFYKIPIEEITKEQRTAAKKTNFGVLYGMESKRLAGELNVSEKVAEGLIHTFFTTFSGIKHWVAKTKLFAMQNRYVCSNFGRKRRIPAIVSQDKMLRLEAERQAVNAPIQGLGSDFMMLSLVRISKLIRNNPKLGAKLVATVHDSVVLECSEKYAKQLADAVLKIMSDFHFDWMNGVPIEAEIKIGKNWAKMEVYSG